MNMMSYEYDGDIIVVDCGLMFPDAELLGVDVVVPDFSYLRENRARLRGIVLTHAHEDHIGGLPYLLDEVDAPVYGSPFTLALVRAKLEEHNMADSVRLVEMLPRQPFEVGRFHIEFIHLTHSTIDSGALALTTPLGTIIHSSDFKFDPTPPDQKVSDLHTLADYGRRGVLALFSDSTNIDRPGLTPSERAVRQRLSHIFSEAEGRVLISCFASSLHRLQLVADLAHEHGRRLCFVGRSMFQNSEIAMRLGKLHVPDGLLIQPQDVKRLPPKQVALALTGSQGEPLAALSRVAVNNHRWVAVEPGDEVVISARVIPGNEKAIYRVIDHLYRRGARVFLPRREPAARARFRTRQRGGTKTHAEPGAPQVLRAHPRRVPATLPPPATGARVGGRVGGGFSAGKRRCSGVRRARGAEGGARAGGPGLYRRGHAR